VSPMRSSSGCCGRDGWNWPRAVPRRTR
jgi:hypothetical protein